MNTTAKAVEEFIAEEVTDKQLYDSATVAALTTRIDELLQTCQMQQKEMERLRSKMLILTQDARQNRTQAMLAIDELTTGASRGERYRLTRQLAAIHHLLQIVADDKQKDAIAGIPF